MELKFGKECVAKIINKYYDLEAYNFSYANLNINTRIHAVTSVASVCYNKESAIGSKSLYDRLHAESTGLPSSSYEFIPMLIRFDYIDDYNLARLDESKMLNMLKYGFEISIDGEDYLLTNYRAAVYDTENMDLGYLENIVVPKPIDIFNTEEECAIINDAGYGLVYKAVIDTNTRAQLVRLRDAKYQELSRRYVSGKKLEFSYYISEDIANKYTRHNIVDKDGHMFQIEISTEELFRMNEAHYHSLMNQGVKAQSARRVIPQAMNTTIWFAFNSPNSYENFMHLRLDNSAQLEIRELAKAIKIITNDYNSLEEKPSVVFKDDNVENHPKLQDFMDKNFLVVD